VLAGRAGTFSVTLTTLGSQTVTASDLLSSTSTGTSNVINVVPPPATHFTVSGPTNAVTAGNAVSFTVTALDQFNHAASGYAGTVTFSSSDSGAILAPGELLTSGTGVFSATLVTAGSQLLTATDTVTGSILGSTGVDVAAGSTAQLAVTAPTYGVAHTAFQFTVTAEDGYGNATTGYNGAVNFSSNDTTASLPAQGFLTNGTGIFSATFTAVGSHTLTASDAATGTIKGSRAIIVPVTLDVADVVPGGAAGPNYPGGTVTVSIHVNALDDPASPYSQSGLSSGNFVLYYNPSVFTVSPSDLQLGTIANPTPGDPTGTGLGDGFSPGSPNGWNVSSTASPPGYLNVLLSNNNSSAFVYGTNGGSLVTVTFHILPNAPLGPSTIDLAADTDGNQPNTYLADSVDALQTFLDYNLYPALADNTVLSPHYALVGSDPNNAVITVTAAPTHFAVAAAVSVQAGHVMSFTVTAEDQFNDPVTLYNGTLQFASSDSLAVLADPGTLTSGVGVFAAVLRTAGNQSITAADTLNNALTGTTGAFAVVPGAASQFAVNAPASAAAGTAFSLTVTALDQYGNTVTNYPGTVHLGSNDSLAILPADSPLTSGVGVFTATLRTAGSQSLSVADVNIGSITGNAAIQVNATTATHLVLAAAGSNTAGNLFLFTVSAEDQFNNVVPGYSGTVAFTSSDSQAALPSQAILSSGIGTFGAILRTAGNQSLTASDTANGVTPDTGTITVTPAAASQFAVTATLPVYPGITSGPSSFASTGIPLVFTVTALDPFGNLVPNYAGTVQFSSSDSAALLPASGNLTNGVGAFTATLETPGNQLLIATDSISPSVSGAKSIVTRGLVVTSFTPTPSGFVVTFNKPFAAGLVNTYTSATTPDDVMLATASSQVSVHGSALFNSPSGPTSLTFVKTDLANAAGTFNPSSGLLSAGNYTVTLRAFSTASGAGFQDALGSSLDGGNQANPGVNFVQTFSVTAPPTAVGIPDFARGPSNTDLLFLPAGIGVGNTFNLIYTNPNTSPSTGTATITFSTIAATLQQSIQNALSSGGLATQIGLNSSNLNNAVPAVLNPNTIATQGANVLITFQNAYFATATNQLLASTTPGVSITLATINAANNIASNGIPVALSNGLNVTSGSFTLQYDPTLLHISGVVSKIPGASFTATITELGHAGTAILSLSSPTRIGSTSSALTIGSLLATVPFGATATYGATQLLHFTNLQLNGTTGPMAVTNQDAVEVAAFYGDVNDTGLPFASNNAVATIANVAALNPNVLQQTLPGFSQFPNLDPVIIGEVNLSPTITITSSDTNKMNQELTAPQPTIPWIPAGLTVSIVSPSSVQGPMLAVPTQPTLNIGLFSWRRRHRMLGELG
jgi:hypothetical protein